MTITHASGEVIHLTFDLATALLDTGLCPGCLARMLDVCPECGLIGEHLWDMMETIHAMRTEANHAPRT